VEPEQVDQVAEPADVPGADVYSREEEQQLAARLQELGYLE
jgi:hypothetical protein